MEKIPLVFLNEIYTKNLIKTKILPFVTPNKILKYKLLTSENVIVLQLENAVNECNPSTYRVFWTIISFKLVTSTHDNLLTEEIFPWF